MTLNVIVSSCQDLGTPCEIFLVGLALFCSFTRCFFFRLIGHKRQRRSQEFVFGGALLMLERPKFEVDSRERGKGSWGASIGPRPEMHFGRIRSPGNASSGCKCRFIAVIRRALNHMRNFQAAEKTWLLILGVHLHPVHPCLCH